MSPPWCHSSSPSSSTYNFAGKLYNRLLVAFQKGDLETAKLEQRRSQAMVKVHNKYGKRNKLKFCIESSTVIILNYYYLLLKYMLTKYINITFFNYMKVT